MTILYIFDIDYARTFSKILDIVFLKDRSFSHSTALFALTVEKVMGGAPIFLSIYVI